MMEEFYSGGSRITNRILSKISLLKTQQQFILSDNYYKPTSTAITSCITNQVVPYLCRCSIEYLGVKVGIASEVQISSNCIAQNQQGIEVISSSPLIYLNKIEKQTNYGIYCHTYKKYICMAQIKKNISIVGNGSNGIIIEGENNCTKIVQNSMIGFNGESGIRVEKGAFPLILSNRIHRNYKEGILLTENCNGIVQKNEISQNIECNIALGGHNSHHTLVIGNSIVSSIGSGIIAIESGKCKIISNDICRNNNGMLIVGSLMEIRHNYIAYNNNNGIEMELECRLKVIGNFITRNQSVGMFIRSKQQNNIIHSNIIVSNQIDVTLECSNRTLKMLLESSNTLETDIMVPQSIDCSIM